MSLLSPKIPPDKKELISLLSLDDFNEIFELADNCRAENVGNFIHLRALLEVSNYCRRRCKYCGLNATNTSAERYRLSLNEIVETTLAAYEAGYKTIVLQSGEEPDYTIEVVGEAVKKIRSATDMAITLSCGELSEEQYSYLKECGAGRYLLKQETADSEIYSALHPCGTLETRINCLKTLKRLGYEAGSGFMIGLPNQTLETIAEDILLIKELDCDMAGIGPFIPHPKTELRDLPHGDTELTLRAVALTRLLMPKIHLPATTALGVVDQSQKDKIFSCGANVIMKKVTPPKVLKQYDIYPSNIRPIGISEGRRLAEEEIAALGRIPL